MSDIDTVPAVDAVLTVDADLRVEVTGASGASSTVRITGHGHRLRVQAQRPEVLLAAVDRADVGRVADLLAATGITVSVGGPDGALATLGAGTSSRLGRLATGSARVAPVPRAALRIVWASPVVRWVTAAVPFGVTVIVAIRSARKGPS